MVLLRKNSTSHLHMTSFSRVHSEWTLSCLPEHTPQDWHWLVPVMPEKFFPGTHRIHSRFVPTVTVAPQGIDKPKPSLHFGQGQQTTHLPVVALMNLICCAEQFEHCGLTIVQSTDETHTCQSKHSRKECSIWNHCI